MGVIERVATEIAAGRSPMNRRVVTREAARLLAREAPHGPTRLADQVADAVLGLGPVEPLLRDPGVTDVLVNGPDEIWVDRDGDLQRVEASFAGDGELIAAVDRVLAPLGLRVDRSSPLVAARLPDGSRLQVVVPPASVDHPVLAIRRFTQAIGSVDELIERGGATAEQARGLETAVEGRKTILISGGTGSGKTTLLNVLGGLIPLGERIVTIEDAAELSIPGHRVRLEAHPANAEGVGEVTIRQLLRSALRLRPDRLIVGEVRGAEALDLVSALNTGHYGSMSTVHANSPREALWRLETLALSAGDTSERAIRRQLFSAIDLVVHLERVGKIRRIATMEEVPAPADDEW
ncbi:MAG: ATPase, T2SS/T4P/T4SS family [Acidimicrobiia bacterium]